MLALLLTGCEAETTRIIEGPPFSPTRRFTHTFPPGGTFTRTPTPTPTFTGTATFTVTPPASSTPTVTSTATGSQTATSTAANTSTPSSTVTGTSTPSATSTGTITATASDTPTFTQTATATGTPTITLSPTITDTPTITSTATETPTPSITPTPTATPEATSTVTRTATATVTSTAPPTSSPTATPQFTCGNGLLEPGETCASCASDCTVGLCAPGTPLRVIEVRLAVPSGQTASSGTFLVGYRSNRVSLPGSGSASTVRGRVKNTPGNTLVQVNDFDYALRVVLSRAGGLPQGRIFTVDFDSCQGATAPAASDFACAVEGCAGQFGPLAGCACSVVIP